MIKIKNKAYEKYKVTRHENHRIYYKELCKLVTEAIKKEKIAYMRHRIHVCNRSPKQLWQTLEKLNIHKKPIKIISENITPDQFNQYLIEQNNNHSVSQDTMSFFENNIRPGITNELQFEPITEVEIKDTINRIHSNAAGVDQMTLKMVKIVFPYCQSALTHIMNHSFKTGIFPNQWKIATIIPLPKKPKASVVSDLRPISILPIFSKLMEAIVKSRLLYHMQMYNIIPSVQSGYRPNHSTNTALLKVINDCVEAMDKGRVTTLIALDYSKAFDTINHDLLLAKLNYYGCSNLVVNWFRSYLKCRKQIVKIGKETSGITNITEGVPQGSVLGPVLFTIFTADMLCCLLPKFVFHLYADDTQLYTSFNVQETFQAAVSINKQINVIISWNGRNGLHLNRKKCEALCIGSVHNISRVLPDLKRLIKIEDDNLQFRDSIKILGVHIDSQLKFHHHVNYVLSKCYPKFGYLYQFKNYLDSNVKWKLCNTLLISNFDYCSSVYYQHLTKEFKYKLQLMQNTCLRFSYLLPFREHITPNYFKLAILKIEERFNLIYIRAVYSIIKKGEPVYLIKCLRRREDIHQRNLRNKEPYDIPKHATEKFKASFSYICTKILNEYGDKIVSSNSFISLKTQIVAYFLSKYLS